MFGTFLDNYTIFTDLLLDQNYLLGTIDHKVTAGIQWTFLKTTHIILRVI